MIGDAIIEFRGVEKALGESFPLRVNDFTFREHERVVLSGLPGVMGEAFMNLIVGALLPDEGDVIVFGTNTKDIRTDTEWLTSLDRFGLVSNRAVLLDQSTVAQNLALPLTLAIDPMAPDVRAAVEGLAREVDLPLELLDRPVNALGASADPIAVRARMHLARALAHQPRVLLLEHPTVMTHQTPYKLGARLRSIADARKLSFIAVSDDDRFARETGAERLCVAREGAVRKAGFALKWSPFRWGG
jgi:ABC-type lipoprotein export system ATPase subunit